MREFIALVILIFLAWLTYDNSSCSEKKRVETPTENVVNEAPAEEAPVKEAKPEPEVEEEEPVYSSSEIQEDEREKEEVYLSESNEEDERSEDSESTESHEGE